MAILPTHAGKRAYIPLDQFDEATHFDVIVIGSGMGGMSTAAALARMQRKVLILEQHYIPGGYTHMFARKGFHWDAGIHAIGEMAEDSPSRKMLDWVGRGQVQWESLGNPFDVFRFSDGFEWGLPDSKGAFLSQLYEAFPEQKAALDRYFERVALAIKGATMLLGGKSMGAGFSGLVNRVANRRGKAIWLQTTDEVMDECGIKGRLRVILTLHWGYYGSIPAESSFGIHAVTHDHFWKGAYFPVGGSKSIASALLGTVIEAGGKVVTKAAVKELMVQGRRAVGVKMENGREFRAETIVSAAGAKNSVNFLVPGEWRQSDWAQSIRSIPNSPPYICMNLGFHGDIAAAGAMKSNLWLMDEWDNSTTYWDPNERPHPHILYCSFPSLKDPTYDPGPRQKHTGEAITFMDWSWFEKWENSHHGEREADYEALKARIETQLLATMRQRLPELMELLVHHELSTPISAQHFVRAEQGAIYGLEASPARFANKELRTRTPIKGFYLSGGDVVSLGVMGAMTSGVLTAASIDFRIYRRFF